MNELMTRERCEAELNKMIRMMIDIYHQYNPNGNYLAIAYLNEDGDGYVSCNNHYHAADEQTGEPAGEDFDHPINFHTLAPLKIEEEAAHSKAFKHMTVTGFTSEEMEEIQKLNSDVGKDAAKERALEIIDKRNHNRGTCWANGYGIYGFNVGRSGCSFLIGSSCD